MFTSTPPATIAFTHSAQPSREAYKERRQAAGKRPARPRLGAHVGRPFHKPRRVVACRRHVVDGGTRIEVGAALHQFLHHFRLALSGSPHQCGLISLLLLRIDVGAVVEKQPRRSDVGRLVQ